MDQIVDPDYPQGNIRKNYSGDSAGSIHAQGYPFWLTVIARLFSAELKRDQSSVSRTFDEIKKQNVVMYGSKPNSLNDSHRQNLTRMLREGVAHYWADDTLLACILSAIETELPFYS